MHLTCPICKKELIQNERNFSCERGHSFDKAKSGYVNLLMSQKSAEKRHGDDKTMVAARRKFLEKGYYNCLATEICRLADRHFSNGLIVDAGCGEGFYTHHVLETVGERAVGCVGVDISKHALEAACKKGQGLTCAVASVFDIPVADESCAMVMNIFAPVAHEEYCRILKKGGMLLLAVPLERHLFGLKEAVYDLPYLNAAPKSEYAGFQLIERSEIRQTLSLDNNEDILSLFMMTPYYYKTSREDFAKLQRLSELVTELEFAVFVYKKL